MNASHTAKKILFVGQQPETVNFSDPTLPGGFDAARIHASIAVGMQKMAERGWNADLCLLHPDNNPTVVLENHLATTHYDCVVIGGGIRIPPDSLLLFEKLINAVHRMAPHAAIAFNTTPLDTADSAGRWVESE